MKLANSFGHETAMEPFLFLSCKENARPANEDANQSANSRDRGQRLGPPHFGEEMFGRRDDKGDPNKNNRPQAGGSGAPFRPVRRSVIGREKVSQLGMIQDMQNRRILRGGYFAV